jgi:hypothetical protein
MISITSVTKIELTQSTTLGIEVPLKGLFKVLLKTKVLSMRN